MRALVQRCDGAFVEVAGARVGGFDGPGLTVLVGVARDDAAQQAEKLAAKVWNLRIFDAERFRDTHCLPPGGSRELSAADLGLPVLAVSQFTLYGRTDKGRRPTWEDAAAGDRAEPIVAAFTEALRGFGARVSAGEFGADMRLSLTNDGPITLLVEV